MTKAELIEALKDFPDDMHVRIAIGEESGAYSIGGLGRFCNALGKANNFITVEPGGYYYDDEEEND